MDLEREGGEGGREGGRRGRETGIGREEKREMGSEGGEGIDGRWKEVGRGRERGRGRKKRRGVKVDIMHRCTCV